MFLDLNKKNHSKNQQISSSDGRKVVSEGAKTAFFLFFGLLFILLAFVYNTTYEIWTGFNKILSSPANLLTDYIQLANIGATMMNAGVMILISLGLIKANDLKIDGKLMAAIFTVAGFSFFGKNLFNSIPITIGVFLFAKMNRKPFKDFALQALFGTALGPLVSEFSFNLGLPVWQGLVLGVLMGIFAGFIIPPLATSFPGFHHGFNLYNIGFTAGITGMLFMAILRSMGIDVKTIYVISSGNNISFSIILYSIFAVMLLIGFYLNNWSFRGYRKLLEESGRGGTDFTEISGYGLTVINMALLGFIATSYVLVIGGELNGPTIGGILTVVGFGSAGKHIKNVIPIIIGVLIAKLLNIYEYNSTSAILAALFGTTLAPIAGRYGAISGIIAGVLHMAVTMNISYLHGGMNLYNNGFSGGFIAAALIPFLNSLIKSFKLGLVPDGE
ncbi:MAG: DUF1576 domain-containing protein [Clostridium sp.]|jgi:hypothetical protein|nr:DUF1576 domain-containing protein [Clostridium sp.]